MKRVPIFELTNWASIVMWVFMIAVVVWVVYFGMLFIISIISLFGSFNETYVVNRTGYREEVEYIVQSPQEPLDYTEVEKRYVVGCEYWNGQIEALEAAEVEKDWLKRIMFCESTCNPYAVSYAGAQGLMQYMAKTFYWQGGKDISNPYEQLELALSMYRKGMANHWCCHKSN